MAQINNSKPGPVYTFTVNLQTLQFGSWLQPNSNQVIFQTDLPAGQTPPTTGYIEVNDQKNHRTIWLPGANLANLERRANAQAHTVTNVNGTVVNYPATTLPDGYYRHGDTVIAYGKAGLYLKNTYVSNPAQPSDVLQLVSIQ